MCIEEFVTIVTGIPWSKTLNAGANGSLPVTCPRRPSVCQISLMRFPRGHASQADTGSFRVFPPSRVQHAFSVL